jgi:hypothetical protein
VLHDANLAKHGQQPLQRLRIASANPLLPTAKTQKAIHNLAIQSLDVNVFPIQPSAEISDHDDLLPDGVVSIALIGYSSRIGVEVFIQRPWRSRSIVLEKVKSWFITLSECQAKHAKLCRVAVVQMPMNSGAAINTRHSPGSGIVSELMRNDAGGDTHGSNNIGKIRAQLLHKGLLVAGAGQEPAVKRERVERTEEAQTMDDLTNKRVDRNHALRFQLPEGNVNGPPIGAGIMKAIIGKINTFPDAHSGVAHQ